MSWAADPIRLHHATTRDVADALMRDGFDAGPSHWGTEAVAAYYGEVADEENDAGEPGKSSAVVSVLLSDLDPALLRVDRPAVDEPITTALDLDEDGVHEAWADCEGTWRDSLEIAGSVVYDGPVAASLLTRES